MAHLWGGAEWMVLELGRNRCGEGLLAWVCIWGERGRCRESGDGGGGYGLTVSLILYSLRMGLLREMSSPRKPVRNIITPMRMAARAR